MNNKYKLSLMALSFVMVVSCTSPAPVDVKVQNSIKHLDDLITKLKTRERLTLAKAKHSSAIHTDTPWVDVIPIQKNNYLPARIFNVKAQLNEPFETSIDRVLYKLKSITGLDVVMERDVVGVAQSTSSLEDTNSNSTLSTNTTDSTNSLLQTALESSSSSAQGFPEVKITVSHVGTVRTLLDAVAASIQAEWRYNADKKQVVFFRYVTGIFRYIGTPGETSISSSLSASNTATGSQSNVSFQGDGLSVWTLIEQDITALISEEGKFSVNQVSGLITVRDFPHVIDKIEELIKQHNKHSRKQIIVEVKVFSVVRDKSDARGIDWKLVLGGQGNDRLGFSTQARTSTGAISNLALSSLDVAGNLSNFKGTEIILNNLSTVGDASIVTSTTLRTINNQPVPVRVVRNIVYVSETTSTVTAGVTEITQSSDQVEVGFNLTVLPSVQDNGRDVLMQISMSLSSLDSLEQFGTGGNATQQPQVSSRDFMDRVWVRSGQTIMLTGYESIVNDSRKSGLFDADFWKWGGSLDANDRVESLIVLLTTRVQDVTDAFNTRVN